MAGSFVKTQVVFPNSTSHGLSWTLMDSHGRILFTDSSCLSKTPPLMDSHGLSWTLMAGSYVKTQVVFPKLHLSWPLMDSHGLSWLDFIYRLKLSFQYSTSYGLSWTLAAPNNCREIDILNSNRLERRPLIPIKAEIVVTRSLPVHHLTATDCNAAARANSFVCF